MTHYLLKTLQTNKLMGVRQDGPLPPTKRKSTWTGFKPLSASIPKFRGVVAENRRPNLRRSKFDRNERAKLVRLLEAFNRQTRGPRNQGALKASGVEIAKEMLFEHYNMKTGQLDPCHKTIAKTTGWSVRTVARALKALRLAGILSWFRRSKWTAEGWKPTSNRYLIGQSGSKTSSRQIIEWSDRGVAPLPYLVAVVRDIALRLGVNALT